MGAKALGRIFGASTRGFSIWQEPFARLRPLRALAGENEAYRQYRLPNSLDAARISIVKLFFSVVWLAKTKPLSISIERRLARV